jgi:hypothetical protein
MHDAFCASRVDGFDLVVEMKSQYQHPRSNKQLINQYKISKYEKRSATQRIHCASPFFLFLPFKLYREIKRKEM